MTSLLAGLPDLPGLLGGSYAEHAALLVEEHQRRLEEFPIIYGHPPHAVQEELHCSEASQIMLLASNRLGKSEGGTREYLWRARGDHPYKTVKRHRRIWVGVPTFNFYEETTKPKFFEWCPESWIVDFNDSKKIAVIRHVDGGVCYVHFKTYDQGRKKWQGAGVDYVWLDEEPPEDIFREAFARVVSTRGTFVFTFTAVEGLGWWYDRIYVPGKLKKNRWHIIEGALAEYDESKPLCIGKVLVPHFSYDDVYRFAEVYTDEDERVSRVFGIPRARTGAVYKAFRPEIHVVPGFKVPDHWEIWGTLDPGFHGFAGLVFALSPEGRFFVVGEYFSQEDSTGNRLLELAKMVAAVRPTLTTEDPLVMWVDTANPQVTLDLNVQAQAEAVPIVFASLPQNEKAHKAGFQRVSELIAPRVGRPTPVEVKRPLHKAGEPLLYFFDTLRSEWKVQDEHIEGSRIVWELIRYRWKEKAEESGKDEEDEKSAHGGHAADALRYGVMIRYSPPPNPKEDKLRHLAKASPDRAIWEELERLKEEHPEWEDME